MNFRILSTLLTLFAIASVAHAADLPKPKIDVTVGVHAEACEEFYTADSTMQENFAQPRTGRDAHVANERKVMVRVRFVMS